MFWSGKSFCRYRLTPQTCGQLHNQEGDFREGCGWESKRKDARTVSSFSQRNCFVIVLQLHSVFNYKLCFRPKLKRVSQQFVWQNKLQIPSWHCLKVHWKHCLGSSRSLSNPTRVAAPISKGTAIQTSYCGDMHVHHIMFSTARSHSQPMVSENSLIIKGTLLQGKKKLPLAATLTL